MASFSFDLSECILLVRVSFLRNCQVLLRCDEPSLVGFALLELLRRRTGKVSFEFRSLRPLEFTRRALVGLRLCGAVWSTSISFGVTLKLQTKCLINNTAVVG